MLLPTAQFRHVTLTARRSRLALRMVVQPSFTTWTPGYYYITFSSLGSAFPEGTHRCNALKYYSPDAKDRVTQTEKYLA